jgi:hypothetical protein
MPKYGMKDEVTGLTPKTPKKNAPVEQHAVESSREKEFLLNNIEFVQSNFELVGLPLLYDDEILKD